jgi:hypothetical protein
VKNIHVVQGKGVDNFFDKRNPVKMPGTVQHKAPPGETGGILYFRAGDDKTGSVARVAGQEKLPQALQAVVHTRLCGSGEIDPLLSDRKPIAFVRKFAVFKFGAKNSRPCFVRPAVRIPEARGRLRGKHGNFIGEKTVARYSGNA